MTKINKVLMLLALSGVSLTMSAQQKIVNPDITYSGTPKTYKLAGLTVTGIEGYEDYVLTVSQDSLLDRSWRSRVRLSQML